MNGPKHSNESDMPSWADVTAAHKRIITLATVLDFRLFVTGYGMFFNDETEWCNGKYLFAFPMVSGRRAKLTHELRRRANEMTANMTSRLAAAVYQVNKQYIRAGSKKRIIFADTDRTYEGNPWCDGEDRSPFRHDTFFFNIWSDDLKSEGTVISDKNKSQSVVIGIGGINPKHVLMKLMTLTTMALDSVVGLRGLSPMTQRPRLRSLEGQGWPRMGSVHISLQVIDSGHFSASKDYFGDWKKAFHPKTFPLANIAARVYQTWLNLDPN